MVQEERKNLSILVSGCGSIGQRHLSNLRSLGVQRLATCDPDPTRLEPVVEALEVQGYSDFWGALSAFQPDVVFVCTPPVYHVSQALEALHSGAHVFIEKPLSHSVDGVDELLAEAARSGRVVQVGYNLRFHPLLGKVKELLAKGNIGRVQWGRVEAGQYLPDWRPWQDYRASYTARHDLGGGIILDGSHELDYVTWLLGPPVKVCCMAGKISNLEVDVEDCATVLLRFASGAQADVHMDFVQRVYSRSGKLSGELGVIEWDFVSQQVRWRSAGADSWEMVECRGGFDTTYVLEVQHLFQRIDGGVNPVNTLESARQTLEIALAAKAAAESGREVCLS